MVQHRETRLNWTGKTFFMLISRPQQELIARLGMRCIDPQSMVKPITAFFSRSHAVLKKTAFNMVPDHMVIGRVSVKEKMFRNIFGKATSPDASDVVSGIINADIALSLNPALDSNFQFLNADGWH